MASQQSKLGVYSKIKDKDILDKNRVTDKILWSKLQVRRKVAKDNPLCIYIGAILENYVTF